MNSDMKWTGKRIKSLSLYQEVNKDSWLPTRGLLSREHIPFFIMYAWALSLCFASIGEQYKDALARADEEGWQLPDSIDSQRTALTSLLQGTDPTDKKYTVEGTGPGGKPIHLPSQWLPGFWPLLYLGTIAILHALLALLQVWSVNFKCFIRMRKLTVSSNSSIAEATHVRVEPRASHGASKVLLLPLQNGPLGPFFEYHRRMYVYDPRERQFVKVRCPTQLPIGQFKQWKGLPSDAAIVHTRTKYGANRFEMATPEFWTLYRQQILSPFTIFQLFCTGLWLLDDYWRYSMFTLFMILTFESTTVFQRLKSINSLKGMGLDNLPILVYRCGIWQQTYTEDLLPGDLFSLKLGSGNSGDLVPCDCVLLTGSCVVNEATLTGESIPQMKEGLMRAAIPNDEILDLKAGHHKVHVLFGGTKLLTSDTADNNTNDIDGNNNQHNDASQIIHEAPPDGGCLSYVLRTGFSSSQGKLVRMIEGSTEQVRSDTRDTSLLLLILLIFAVSASGYVLKEGMKEGNKRSKYQLLLHCILIITSVIPPELPMQMALAVNSSLMTLMKMNVFCTEPFRIPMAGKVDVCLFDKTGTLTTDELVAVGVSPHTCNRQDSNRQNNNDNNSNTTESSSLLVNMNAIPSSAVLVLGGCQSLVVINNKCAGDPVESAAIKAIRWEVPEHRPNISRPKPERVKKNTNNNNTNNKNVTASSNNTDNDDDDVRTRKPIIVDGVTIAEVDIKTRHHFSSTLQRMSVIIKTTSTFSNNNNTQSSNRSTGWVLAKGSPEVIGTLLQVNNKPLDYNDRAAVLAKQGMRVLALAYKKLSSDEEVKAASNDRSIAESNLLFAGFVAFTCRVRKDTADVIAQLREGNHSVIMVTGDALLTAIHVAKEVGITDSTPQPQLTPIAIQPGLASSSQALWKPKHKSGGILTLDIIKQSNTDNNNKESDVYWCDYTSGNIVEAFDINRVETLYKDYDLAVTGTSLNAAATKANVCEGNTLPGHILKCICVYARMRPDQKESIILSMKSSGCICMMCGDGANDVGALKQAQVGVALLSGFGDINVDRDNSKKPKIAPITTKEQYEQLRKLTIPELKAKLREAGIEPNEHPNVQQKEDLMRLYAQHSVGGIKKDAVVLTLAQQRAEAARKQKEKTAETLEKYQQHVRDLEARGESWAPVKAAMLMRKEEADRIKAERSKGINSIEGSASRIASLMDDMNDENDTPTVKIGDASVASPFTSKMPSIKGCVDIIRQGRCTLVTSIQMYQILALNCLISAYSLSVLYLEGFKNGDTQMTALGILMTISFITISRAKPLNRLSSVRPLNSIFSPALFISISGQFILHIATMVYAVNAAKSHMNSDENTKVVVDLDGEFKPNLTNAVVFLVGAVQQVSVFVVNLKGRPFMGGLSDNTPLLYSLAATFALVFMCASETIPKLNTYLQLEPFPSEQFRNNLLICLSLDIGAAFLWDRLMLMIFAPKILIASFEGTTIKDVFKLIKVIAVCTGIIYFLAIQEYPEELLEAIEEAKREQQQKQ